MSNGKRSRPILCSNTSPRTFLLNVMSVADIFCDCLQNKCGHFVSETRYFYTIPTTSSKFVCILSGQ